MQSVDNGRRTEQRDDGILYAVAGQSRMGKTAWVQQQIAEAQRLIVWDPRMEYRVGAQTANSIHQLSNMLRECGTGAARIIYQPGNLQAEFESWCRLAYLWGQLWPCVVVAEEIADVTSPGKAPQGWGELIRKGLYYGIHIYSITQRPQETDKTVWGNATCIHSHWLRLPADQDYMAKRIGIQAEEIARLNKLEYVELWAGEKAARHGKVVL